MKKIMIIIMLVISIFTFSLQEVKADLVYYTLLESENSEGDSLKFQRENENFGFRVCLNQEAIDFNFEGKNVNWLYFLETTKYYLYYGSIMNYGDILNTNPFILRLEKNLSDYKIYIDEEVSGSAYAQSIIEFPIGEFIVTNLYDGEFVGGNYDGFSKLLSLDENFHKLAEIDIGKIAKSTAIAYDVIEVKRKDNTVIYFDQEFNIVEGYSKIEDYSSSFSILVDTLVNDVFYNKGSSFNIPGTYVLSLEGFMDRVVTLHPSIEGIKNNGRYKGQVRFMVTGGDVFLDDKPVYLNGVISDVGSHVIKIKGINNYEELLTFTILPSLISNIESGDILEIGDELKFNGTALLNNSNIKSGYKIKTPGSYELKLLANNEVCEVVFFSVNESMESPKETRVWIYVSIIGAIVLFGGVFTFIAIYKKKKRTY